MKTYTKQELETILKSQIANNSNKAVHALMTVYNCQTTDEKLDGVTEVRNGIGFSSVDSPILSSFAEQYKTRGTLSENQIALVKRLMPRYARQLLRMSFIKGNFEKVGRKWAIKK